MTEKKLRNRSFVELRNELDSVMNHLQEENLDIDEAIKLYKRGQELVAELSKYIKEAKNEISKLKKGE